MKTFSSLVYPLIITVIFMSCADGAKIDQRNTDYQYYRNHSTQQPKEIEEINHVVTGKTPDGSTFTGKLGLKGKSENAMLEDENGEKKEITVQWVDDKVLQAKDKNGNVYELAVERNGP